MKKNGFRSFIAGLTVVSVALLGACANGDTDEEATPGATEATTEATEGETTDGEATEGEGAGDWGDFSGETLTVVAAWSGAEQANFEQVLAGFEDATGATVNYESFGDNGPTFIQGRLEGGVDHLLGRLSDR